MPPKTLNSPKADPYGGRSIKVEEFKSYLVELFKIIKEDKVDFNPKLIKRGKSHYIKKSIMCLLSSKKI